MNGAYAAAEPLGDSLNGAGNEFDPCIAPDQSHMIFTSDRPGGRGGSDLYVSYRRGDRWIATGEVEPLKYLDLSQFSDPGRRKAEALRIARGR